MRAKRSGANGNKGETTQGANGIRGETTRYPIDTSNSSNTVLLFLILFLWNSPNVYTLVWKKHTNKQKTRKKNVYDEDRKSWFIDRQTTGDKLNETGRQTRKLQNGQMDNTNI